MMQAPGSWKVERRSLLQRNLTGISNYPIIENRLGGFTSNKPAAATASLGGLGSSFTASRYLTTELASPNHLLLHISEWYFRLFVLSIVLPVDGLHLAECYLARLPSFALYLDCISASEIVLPAVHMIVAAHLLTKKFGYSRADFFRIFQQMKMRNIG
jgi:hypothetical protein